MKQGFLGKPNCAANIMLTRAAKKKLKPKPDSPPPAALPPSPYNFEIPLAIQKIAADHSPYSEPLMKKRDANLGERSKDLQVEGTVGDVPELPEGDANDGLIRANDNNNLTDEGTIVVAPKQSVPSFLEAVKQPHYIQATSIADMEHPPGFGPISRPLSKLQSAAVGSDFQPENSATTWSSLFKNKPRNAGRYTTKNFPVGCVDGVLKSPREVIDAGITFWENYVVGFFLDKNLPYLTVCNYFKRAWKLKGKVEVMYDKDLFFFKFSCPEDRSRILESDPYIIMNKTFLITPWNPCIERVREQVRSIRVWVKLRNIPTIYQTVEGLDWIFGHIGKFICFDTSTEKRDRLEYAIALIEITPERQPPTSLSVYLSETETCKVSVNYKWTPSICTRCKSFGHLSQDCPKNPPAPTPPLLPTNSSLPPIQPTVSRIWCAKSIVPTSGTVAFVMEISAIDTPVVTPVAISPLTRDIDMSTYEGLMTYLATAPSDARDHTLDLVDTSLLPPTVTFDPTVPGTHQITNLDPDGYDHGPVYSIDEIIPRHLRDN